MVVEGFEQGGRGRADFVILERTGIDWEKAAKDLFSESALFAFRKMLELLEQGLSLAAHKTIVAGLAAGLLERNRRLPGELAIAVEFHQIARVQPIGGHPDIGAEGQQELAAADVHEVVIENGRGKLHGEVFRDCVGLADDAQDLIRVAVDVDIPVLAGFDGLRGEAPLVAEADVVARILGLDGELEDVGDAVANVRPVVPLQDSQRKTL